MIATDRQHVGGFTMRVVMVMPTKRVQTDLHCGSRPKAHVSTQEVINDSYS